jgi:GTP-binding protein HflX
VPGGAGSPIPAAEESLEELAALAESAGAKVAGRSLQYREAPEAATLIGRGKAGELRDLAAASGSGLAIFDRELTPTQLRNLERELECRVLDRTQLILDIFARRARTREGQLQVELAQLNYLMPRLTGRGVQMSRLAGGIGTRGPGETQLETDRRRISRRIAKIREQLERVRATRGVQRKQRRAVPLATAALVGYTNAGKSSLFNRLTGAQVVTDARMFATLDPTVRPVRLPSNRRVLLSDTVGFIRNLPTTLVKAFRATLEEVTEAALILHVVDVSSPHAIPHIAHVLEVLNEIGAAQTPRLLVLNKIDLLPGPESAPPGAGDGAPGDWPAQQGDRRVPVSARTGEGIEKLLEALDKALPVDPLARARFLFPFGAESQLHLVHEFGRVIETRYGETGILVEAEVPESLLRPLQPYLATL